MFKKSVVALFTPFKDGHIDGQAVTRLVDWHASQGTHALVVGGCTGEGNSLTPDEHEYLLKCALEGAAGRLPIIASTGAVTTHETVTLSKRAQKIGVQGLMIMTPSVVKPLGEGLVAHFAAAHGAVDLPIMLYHNPGRTCGKLEDDTLEALASLPRLLAIKDSTDNLTWPLALKQRFGDRFALLSGEDLTCAAFLAQGGDGTVSVTANVVPHLYARLHDAWRAGDLATFFKTRDAIFPLSKAVLCVTNPIALKCAASLMGLCRDELRLPLTPASPPARAFVEATLHKAGLLTPGQARHA
ncbi:MAG: 4-hydroxy-tetrahydrodipicolinate synthase [Proteobacteria bacterium]|nr:4-hydroxy-tetrahydrodipicolinate synthase [Pseudomonadota bacterium]